MPNFISIFSRSIVACLCLLLWSGCFDTRPVEPPGGGASDWISPTDYQILLDNLQRAYAERNTQNMLRCLSEPAYTFEPSASLFADNESIWRAWVRQDEQVWFDNMVSQLDISSLSLNLIEGDLQNVTPDSIQYRGAYRLSISHTDTTLPTLFLGDVLFNLQINTFNEWEIKGWTDLETTPDSSWSLLKLRFNQ